MYLLIPAVIILTIIYIMNPQIDWWWYKKHPPELDSRMRQFLIKHAAFYNGLSVNDKKKFRNRMALYEMSVEFMPKGWESVPDDIKGIIAANAVRMTFNKANFLLPKYERIVVYPTLFPSPQHPKVFHASELFEEDGVLLFSAKQIMWSFVQSQRCYNLVLHEFIKAYQDIFPDLVFPTVEEKDWGKLEAISGLSKASIEGMIRLPNISPTIVSANFFFTFPNKFRATQPALYKKWAAIFSDALSN